MGSVAGDALGSDWTIREAARRRGETLGPLGPLGRLGSGFLLACETLWPCRRFRRFLSLGETFGAFRALNRLRLSHWPLDALRWRLRRTLLLAG